MTSIVSLILGSDTLLTGLLLSSWINELLFGIAQGILNAAANLLADGLKHFIFFDSPYTDPKMNEAFRHNLDIFPQLLAIAVLVGVASKPFADKLETDSVMLIWKFLKVIIFVAIGRQVMHFSLKLVNAVGLYLYPTDYSMQFASDSLQQALSSAGATGAGLAMTGIILSSLSVLAALLLIGIFMLREFLFTATFVLLPILGCMLYLDFGPFRDAADMAKLLIRGTTYLLLAGVIMAGLLQVGAAHGGAFVDPAAQANSQQSMSELVESYFFWLAGLIAPAYIGLKAAMAAGVSSRQIMGAGSTTPKGSRKGGSPKGGKRRELIEQARHGASKVDSKFNNVGSRTASSVNSIASTASQKSVEHSPDFLQNAAPAYRAGKTTTRRAAKDAKVGSTYAAQNLGESPVAWARSGIDHYREDPLISESTTDETSPGSTNSTEDQTSSSSSGDDSPSTDS